jgi:hypothetical protein
MKKNKLYQLIGATAVIALTVGACSDDDDTNPVSNETPTSNVLIAHASPDAPGVDVFVDNGATPAVPNLEFPDNTGYVSIPAGSRNVKVAVTNTGIGSAVLNADLNLTPGTNYTVFAIDSVSSIEFLVLQDDLTAPASGNAHVRFVHLSPNAPAVDVALQGGGAISPDFAGKSFREATPFTPLAAGTYNLEVRVAGTSTVALPLPGVTLEAGKIYTVFAKGFLGGTGTQALDAGIIVNRE